MEKLLQLWEFLKGKKTYIAALGLLLYGVIERDMESVLLALGLLGVRNGLTNEIKKLK